MVYLHTGPMGVHRACFFIARAGRAATPERNRSGNQPPILCILPLVAHQLASARKLCARPICPPELLAPSRIRSNPPGWSTGLVVPGRVAPGDCSPGAPADPYVPFQAYGSSYHELSTGRLPE